MTNAQSIKNRLTPDAVGAFLRRAVTSWIVAAGAAYVALPRDSRELGSLLWLEHISAVYFVTVAVVVFALLTILRSFIYKKDPARSDLIERCIMAGGFTFLAVFAAVTSSSAPFALACALAFAAFFIYASCGSDRSSEPCAVPAEGGGAQQKSARSRSTICIAVVAVLAVVFVILDGVWTVARINGFATPTFDFTIFSQMFYYMKETGIPYTTVERDGLLSHFAVHLSPAYYLILPLYMIFPYPGTIQVAQALILASAVIPFWKLCRLHGLSDIERTLLSALLLFYPSIAGGTSYDIHENCFLLPFVMWLLYAVDKKSVPVTTVSLILLLSVKEDAAVYGAVIALYVILRALIRGVPAPDGEGGDNSDTAASGKRIDVNGLLLGAGVLFASLLWFGIVNAYLVKYGDGTLANDRYPNFLIGDTSPLVTVVKTALLCPMKILYECADAEKLTFLAQTMLPLLALPLLTRRYERYVLLVPYVIVNLVSDYQYLHDIFFQYTFGSAACLFYLTAVNLADLRIDKYRLFALVTAAASTAALFGSYVIPKAYSYTSRAYVYEAYYDGVREMLDKIPEDASVTATTFYTTYLSRRDALYDVRYSSYEHMLETDYIVLEKSDENSFKKYGGYNALVFRLEQNGYKKFAEYGDSIFIYKKAAAG